MKTKRINWIVWINWIIGTTIVADAKFHQSVIHQSITPFFK